MKTNRRRKALTPRNPVLQTLPPGRPLTLPLSLLRPSPFNQRAGRHDDPELVENVRRLRVLEPLLVRPVGEIFEILAGHRRFAAATAAGLSDVPVMVHEADDDLAKLILASENLYRLDLTPLEEAAAVAQLRAAHLSQEMIADRLGKPVRWVARRIRLDALSPAWRERILDPESLVSTWPAAKLEVIALLEPEAQDLLLVDAESGVFEDCSPADLTHVVAEMTHDLARAPWSPYDETLDPAAGPCALCTFRSSHHPTLFDGLDEPPRSAKKGGPADRCLNPPCWGRKMAAFLTRRETELREKHPNLLLLYDGSYRPQRGEVASWLTEPAKRSTPGAVPALFVEGSRRGTFSWVLPPTARHGRASGAEDPAEGKTAGGRAKSSLAERKLRKTRQRELRAISYVRDACAAAEAVPDLPTLLSLAIVFGTHHRNECGWYSHDPEFPLSSPEDPAAPWTHAQELAGAPGQRLAAELWRQIKPVLLRRLVTSDNPEDIPRAYAEASRLAALLGLEASTFLEQATRELPDPKCWQAEEAAAETPLLAEGTA
ncbi:MAG TPA: ParB/RepB/Spo0J family partition protein [Solirubrobacterales bacterium]|nr:ParB/RepB/Spo0J family partition protein [Solirubrobacterales bacterium]